MGVAGLWGSKGVRWLRGPGFARMGDDLYAVLGVSADAEPAVVRAAYIALVRQYHPDGKDDGEARARAEQRTKAINAAFSVLGDPDQRAAYDARRRRPHLYTSIPRPAPDGVRRPFKGRPNQRKGPSLQDRRRRLQQVKLVTIILAVLGMLLIFGAFTGLVGLLRPSLPDWMSPSPRSSMAGSVGVADLAATEVMADVMLPWPEPSETHSRLMNAGGFQLTFLAGDIGTPPRIKVADAGGSSVTLTGAVELSSDRGNRFGVGRLDGPDKPPVLIVATPASEGCCLSIQFVYRGRDGLKIVDGGEMPSDVAERFPSDLNNDGSPEWILPDRRFIAAFGPSSPPPPMVFRFERGALRDVSANSEFSEVFSNHLAPAQRLCALGSSGACAAFVASAARLGRADWAWDIMLSNYARDPVHQAAGECGAEAVDGACPSADHKGFPDRLRRFLIAAGYVRTSAELD